MTSHDRPEDTAFDLRARAELALAFEPGEHAENSIEFSAGRLGVEMAAHRDRKSVV